MPPMEETIQPAPLSFTKHVKRKDRVYDVPYVPAPLADTHAHLTCFWEKDPVEVLVRAARAGVRALITLWDPLGDDMDLPTYQATLRTWLDAARAQALSDGRIDVTLFDHVRFLAGAHPYGAPDYTDDTHVQLLATLDDPLCVGVGEIGLDYHFDTDDNVAPAAHDVQMACMARQLAVAVERNVPVELHLRNDASDEARTAHQDAYQVLKQVGIPKAGCVLHCFGEDRATLERFAELGCYIAFGGAATFKRNVETREAFAACPPAQLLFETDCPYMAPEPIRGLECEPAMMAFTVEALCHDRAERTGEDPRALVQAGWDNAQRLFFTAQ